MHLLSISIKSYIIRETFFWSWIDMKNQCVFCGFILWEMVYFVLKILRKMTKIYDKNSQFFFVPKGHHANQWYPTISWIEGFNPKAFGAWGQGGEHQLFGELFCPNIFCSSFKTFFDEKKNSFFFYLSIFFTTFFSYVHRIFWNIFWYSRQKNRSKTKFFVELCSHMVIFWKMIDYLL